MDDLISRQMAIDEIKEYTVDPNQAISEYEDNVFYYNSGLKSAVQAIVDLPSAQRWVPCSERLPKERDWYLGVFKEPDTGWINPIPFICDYLLGTKTKATTKGGWILKGFTDGEEYIDYYFNLECVAWMSLPEPYREVEE